MGETTLLTPAVRKTIYTLLAAVGLILASVQVGYSAAELANPSWLTVALAVYAFLAGPTGIIALLNTSTEDDDYQGLHARRE